MKAFLLQLNRINSPTHHNLNETIMTKSNRITRSYNIKENVYKDAKKYADRDGKIISREIEKALVRFVAASS